VERHEPFEKAFHRKNIFSPPASLEKRRENNGLTAKLKLEFFSLWTQ
jgi:hypothetical protein